MNLSRRKVEAEQMLAEIIRRRDHAMLGLELPAVSVDLDDIVDAYLADVEVRTSLAYSRRRRAEIQRVIDGLDASRLPDLNVSAALRMRQRLVLEGLAPKTINYLFIGVTSMLRWATRAGLAAHNPLETLQPLPNPQAVWRRRRRLLTAEEIDAIGRGASAEDTEGRHAQFPLFSTLLLTGARIGELCQVTWADVDLEARVLSLRAETTKAGRRRELPLVAELVALLREHRVRQVRLLDRIPRATERVYRAVRGGPITTKRFGGAFRRWVRKSGVQVRDARGRVIDVHALRHTYATQLALAGTPLQQAQYLLGHANPKITASIYTHLEAKDVRRYLPRRIPGTETAQPTEGEMDEGCKMLLAPDLEAPEQAVGCG